MLFINSKALMAMINQGDNLKHKHSYKKSGHFWVKIFPTNFCLDKKYRKRANKQLLQNLRKNIFR